MLLSLARSIMHRRLWLIAALQWCPGSSGRLNSISFHGLSRLPLNASRWLNSVQEHKTCNIVPSSLAPVGLLFNAQAAVYNQHACWWYRTCGLLFIFLCHNFQMLYTEWIACCSCSHYYLPRKHTWIYTYLLITQRHYYSDAKAQSAAQRWYGLVLDRFSFSFYTCFSVLTNK